MQFPTVCAIVLAGAIPVMKNGKSAYGKRRPVRFK
jgi:hypothetical protein